jgi:hypothetical protein
MIGECSDYTEGHSDHSPRATVVQVESLGRGGVVAVVSAALICVLFAGLSLGVAMRAMDRAALAERESRIVRDEMDRLKVALAQKGIHIETH